MSEKITPVYRLVNGDLVRVPGDVRDPKRRYASVGDATTGETYLREFTDEEERQRDAEEAMWEAQRPQREAEETQRKDAARRFRESLVYEERVVAFLDVLGWSQAIAASVDSPAMTQNFGITAKGIGTHVEFNSWQRQHGGPGGWPGDPMITHFSDSIVISCLADHRAKDDVEWALNGIIDGLLMTGFVLRGGVTHGLLIHRESLVYGPALIRAYELESKQAAMPRVILDHPIAAAWGAGVRVQTRDGALLGYRRTWRQDRDGWFFFDFMADRFWMPGTDKDTTKPQFEWQMGRWRELILKGLSAHSSNAAVFRKYDWLREYFNAVCAENAFDEVAVIPPVAPE